MLELRKQEFDPQLLCVGDRGVVTAPWVPRKEKPSGSGMTVSMPGAVLHMRPFLPTGGALPLYNPITPELLDDGTFVVVPDFTEKDLGAYADQRREQVDRLRETHALFNNDFDLRTQEGRDGFDERFLDLVRQVGDNSLFFFLNHFRASKTDHTLATEGALLSLRRLAERGLVRLEYDPYRKTLIHLTDSYTETGT